MVERRTPERQVQGSNPTSSIGPSLGSIKSQNGGQDAAMAPIQEDVQAQLRVMTSDDPVTRSVSPRKVS